MPRGSVAYVLPKIRSGPQSQWVHLTILRRAIQSNLSPSGEFGRIAIQSCQNLGKTARLGQAAAIDDDPSHSPPKPSLGLPLGSGCQWSIHRVDRMEKTQLNEPQSGNLHLKLLKDGTSAFANRRRYVRRAAETRRQVHGFERGQPSNPGGWALRLELLFALSSTEFPVAHLASTFHDST